MSFIKASKQIWKIVISMTPIAICGLIVIFQSYLYEPIGEDLTMSIVLSSTILGMVFFIWGCLFIRCPKCKLRLFWHAVTKQDSGVWVTWLFSFVECPRCQYKPDI
jgi:hypothetical protein